MRDYWECGIATIVHTFRSALNQELEKEAGRVQCPLLVVRGLRDPIVPQRWAERLTSLLPRGRLIELPGVPHTANLEAPLELLRVARPFLLQERGRRAALA